MTITVDSEDLLDNEQAAELLGIKPNTLEVWRHKGKGPAFHKFGNTRQAHVRYRRSAILEWLGQHSFASTSAYSPAALANVKPQISRSAEVSA